MGVQIQSRLTRPVQSAAINSPLQMGVEMVDVNHTGMVSAGLTPEAELITGILGMLDDRTSGDSEVDYKRLYYYLFNGLTDALEGAKTYLNMVDAIKLLQSCAEELFLQLSLPRGQGE